MLQTYQYYSLPVCHPDQIKFRTLTLGEVLDGDRMAESLYDIRFKENVGEKSLCTMKINAKDRDHVSGYCYFVLLCAQ